MKKLVNPPPLKKVVIKNKCYNLLRFDTILPVRVDKGEDELHKKKTNLFRCKNDELTLLELRLKVGE
jgi:hypothetical protein